MGFEQIVPAIFLIAVLILVIPGFLRSNSGSKQFFKNLFIWSIIIAFAFLSIIAILVRTYYPDLLLIRFIFFGLAIFIIVFKVDWSK